MSDQETPARPARNRSPAARAAARARKATREARILESLAAGMSMAGIAMREDVTLNRMRKIVQAIVEKRRPQPPTTYVAREAERLHESLNVAYDAIGAPDVRRSLSAIDAIVRIVRDLDRINGFGRSARTRPENSSQTSGGIKSGVGNGSTRPRRSRTLAARRSARLRPPGNFVARV